MKTVLAGAADLLGNIRNAHTVANIKITRSLIPFYCTAVPNVITF